MDKVKKLVAAGASIPGAIREALSQNGLSVRDFAKKYAISRQSAGLHISGTVRASEETISALVQELGGTPAEWAELLWLAGKPAEVPAIPTRKRVVGAR